MGDHVAFSLLDTEDLIKRWADAVRGEERLSPWPKQSMLALIGKYGKDTRVHLSAKPAPLSDELMDVDAAVAALDKEEREVLVVASLYFRVEPRMMQARALRLSLDQFNRKLGRARRRVHDILKGMRIGRRAA